MSLLIASTIVLTLAACSTKSRHRIIIYDQSWSSAAGVKNLWCAAEYKAACERQAREAELDFSKRLSTAFRTSPECATVQFLVSPENKNSKDLEDRLAYWRLQVDFRPGLTQQPFSLGLGRDKPLIGGDDAEHEADFICEAAKNNGVVAIW